MVARASTIQERQCKSTRIVLLPMVNAIVVQKQVQEWSQKQET